MITWLKNWWRRHNDPKMPFVDMVGFKPKKEIGDEFVEWDGVCPDCGGGQWHEGPSGGMCVNIRCANEACHTKLNVMMLPGLVRAQRIGKSKLDPEKCNDR